MFWPIWPSCFRVEDFYKSPNQKQTRIACAGITLGFYVDHDGQRSFLVDNDYKAIHSLIKV
jgi:hypothetical protein